MTIPRTELLNSLVDTFSHQSEVSRIVTFGREVSGETDEFSDIDLMLCSDDLHNTRSNYKRLLNAISPVLGSYVLRLTETELVEMILLENVSPYQKLDLSISHEAGRQGQTTQDPAVSSRLLPGHEFPACYAGNRCALHSPD